jgi:hypothetical protein
VYVPVICLCVSFEPCLPKAVPFDGELLMFFSSDFKLRLLAPHSGLSSRSIFWASIHVIPIWLPCSSRGEGFDSRNRDLAIVFF